MSAKRDRLDSVRCDSGLASSGEVALGFDDANVTVRQHARLRELLPERVRLVPAADWWSASSGEGAPRR